TTVTETFLVTVTDSNGETATASSEGPEHGTNVSRTIDGGSVLTGSVTEDGSSTASGDVDGVPGGDTGDTIASYSVNTTNGTYGRSEERRVGEEWRYRLAKNRAAKKHLEGTKTGKGRF